MKALQIKYFGPTNTLGARLKLSVEGFPATYEGRDYALEVYEQALSMAEWFIAKHDFPPVSGIGSINGVYYVTIGGVK
jgi:hypothetical protein